MWHLEHTEGFRKISTRDLVFDPWHDPFSISSHDSNEADIVTMFHEYQTENLASTADILFL